MSESPLATDWSGSGSPPWSGGAGAGEPAVPSDDLPEIYYAHRAKCYFRKAADGRFIEAGAPSITRLLKSLGYSSKVQPDAFLSPKDAAIETIETTRCVEYAGVLAGHKAGLFRIYGRAVLVTEGPILPVPKPGPWPHLKAFFESLLGEEQCQHFYGHLKLTDECLRAGIPRPGQIMIVAGPVKCGKSLLASLLTEIWGGSVAKPYAYLTGKTEFNRELFESVLLLIDDEAPDPNPKVRKILGSGLKSLTMDRAQRCHGKGVEGLTLNPTWRVVLLLNNDAPSLQVLPQMDSGLIDKLLLFQASPAVLPVSGERLEDQAKLWDTLAGELPAFLHFLQSWEIPQNLRDSRFGIRHYHNQEILALFDGLSDEQRLLELIDTHLFKDMQTGALRFRASELETELRSVSSALAGKLFFSTSACGTLLGLLASRHPSRVKKGSIVHGTQTWLLYPPSSAGAEAAAQDPGEAEEEF